MLETLVKLWETKTIKNAIVDRKERIADCKREGMKAERWVKELAVLKAELAKR